MFNNWQAVAFNQVPHSKNQIHGDDVAKAYGFKGGLVPGVTVSAYLLHPAAVAFADDFLTRGVAHVRVNSPLYDGERFDVEIHQQSASGYSGHLTPEGKSPSATVDLQIVESHEDIPTLRGDSNADSHEAEIPASRENMQALMDAGCKAFSYRWDPRHDMSTYLKNKSAMADIYSLDGIANPSFVLGVSNWVLASNAIMNPWVHMETRSRHFAPIHNDTKIIGEMKITDLFDRKGHEFVDATVNLFDAESAQCFASVQLRAIYQLRAA